MKNFQFLIFSPLLMVAFCNHHLDTRNLCYTHLYTLLNTVSLTILLTTYTWHTVPSINSSYHSLPPFLIHSLWLLFYSDIILLVLHLRLTLPTVSLNNDQTYQSLLKKYKHLSLHLNYLFNKIQFSRLCCVLLQC